MLWKYESRLIGRVYVVLDHVALVTPVFKGARSAVGHDFLIYLTGGAPPFQLDGMTKEEVQGLWDALERYHAEKAPPDGLPF